MLTQLSSIWKNYFEGCQQNLRFSSFYSWNNEFALANSMVGFTIDLTILNSFAESTD